MAKISAVINVVREEIRLLPRALRSLNKFADEIVIVDMTDDPELSAIAEKYKAKVYSHPLVPYVEIARNFGIEKAVGEWILVLDPDEEISENLRAKLTSICQNPTADYFRLPRKNIIFGKWLKNSRWWPDYNIRFFKKGSVSWNEIIHSVPLTKGKGADIEAKEDSAIIHHHYETVEQYVERLNRYTAAQAKNISAGGYKFRWQDILRKPFSEFLSRYFAGEGYRDGLHGLVLSILQGYSEFVVYLKVWQAEGFHEKNIKISELKFEINRLKKDLNYWQADTEIKNKGGLIPRIKRRFRIP